MVRRIISMIFAAALLLSQNISAMAHCAALGPDDQHPHGVSAHVGGNHGSKAQSATWTLEDESNHGHLHGGNQKSGHGYSSMNGDCSISIFGVTPEATGDFSRIEQKEPFAVAVGSVLSATSRSLPTPPPNFPL